MEYDTGYPKVRIGGGNPYMMCASCGVSEPEINGDIKKHTPWCEYRIHKMNENLYPYQYQELHDDKLKEILERFGVMDDELYAALDDLLDEAYMSGN